MYNTRCYIQTSMGSKGLSYVGKNFTSTILPLVKTTILPMVAKTVGSTSIAGIAIGGTTGSLSIVLISVAAYFLYRKRKKRNNRGSENNSANEDIEMGNLADANERN
ncbi:uncharacterized protein LOC144620554 isoform X2 [Crassostrea virginica]